VSEPERPKLDLARVAKLLGVAGSSQHEGEAVNAIRMVDRVLRAAGMRWPDLTDGHHRAEVATEAATGLIGELAAANERIAVLEAEFSRGTAVAVWQDVGAQISSTPGAAKWALELNQRGLVWLSDKEIDFLNRVTVWVGPLTPRMRPFFENVMDRILTRTGLVPPV
jgi:hypothetical protein